MQRNLSSQVKVLILTVLFCVIVLGLVGLSPKPTRAQGGQTTVIRNGPVLPVCSSVTQGIFLQTTNVSTTQPIGIYLCSLNGGTYSWQLLIANGTNGIQVNGVSIGPAPACVAGTGSFWCGTEGTADTPVANADTIDFISATHTANVNNNNTGDMPLSRAPCVNVTPIAVSANVATDQLLMSCTLSANLLNVVGHTLKIYAAAVYSTPAASTATINMKAKLCTVSGCGSGTVVTLATITSTANPGTITNNAVQLNLDVATQTAGSSSAYEAHGWMVIDLGSTGLAADTVFADTNSATVGTIDSTGQLFLQITGAFSAASASNSMTERLLRVELVN
jgi:hypothetical protein